MRLDAAASSVLRHALAGSPQPATWLGVTPAALYLRIEQHGWGSTVARAAAEAQPRRSRGWQPGVVALLAHDAVRLPCALVLPATTAELPLTAMADGTGGAVIGDDCLAWAGPAGPVVVRSVREWAPARVRPGACSAGRLAALLDAWPAPGELHGWAPAVARATADPQRRCWDPGALISLLPTEPAAAIGGLLGLGPGLTPAGDDVVAGFLLGAEACGLDTAEARAVVAAMAHDRTTALSAALLWHAARGECISEVAAVLAAPSDSKLAELLRVGHTSGAALATGLASAASAALFAGLAA